MNRSALVTIAIVVALAAGWSAVRSAGQDVVTLRTFDLQGLDRYTTLWALDDGRFVWIRANRSDRKWLAQLRVSPNVELRRRGRTRKYTAKFFDRARMAPDIEERFRQKYGLADEWRSRTIGTDTVLVRLGPR